VSVYKGIAIANSSRSVEASCGYADTGTGGLFIRVDVNPACSLAGTTTTKQPHLPWLQPPCLITAQSCHPTWQSESAQSMRQSQLIHLPIRCELLRHLCESSDLLPLRQKIQTK